MVLLARFYGYTRMTGQFQDHLYFRHTYEPTYAPPGLACIVPYDGLVDQYRGQVPRTREALEALPGVGRKTANVILNNAFGDPTLAVDTHVFRVANRTGLAVGKTPIEVELRLLERVPEAFLPNAHHWLILHGRYVCQAKRPLCEVCAVVRWCDSGPPALKRAATPSAGGG